MVSHTRTRFFRGSAGAHAGSLRLLLVSPPNGTAVLRSRPQLIPGISSTGPALHFFRDRSGEVAPRGFRLAPLSSIACASRGDPAGDHPIVHHRNAPRRTPGFDARRLRPAGIDPAYSRDQVL